jgi:hypothetical protein
MIQKVYGILREKNIDSNKFNIDILCDAGLRNIINNVEFYYDKPYSCESVLKELFTRGVIEKIKNLNQID